MTGAIEKVAKAPPRSRWPGLLAAYGASSVRSASGSYEDVPGRTWAVREGADGPCVDQFGQRVGPRDPKAWVSLREAWARLQDPRQLAGDVLALALRMNGNRSLRVVQIFGLEDPIAQRFVVAALEGSSATRNGGCGYVEVGFDSELVALVPDLGWPYAAAELAIRGAGRILTSTPELWPLTGAQASSGALQPYAHSIAAEALCSVLQVLTGQKPDRRRLLAA